MEEPALGDVVDRYRIDAELGRGGMGVVYRATHLGLDAPRALKLVSPALAGDEAFRRRFDREARLASRLRHPNVAAVHDYGNDGGTLFLVMELLEGPDLARLVADTGPLPAARAVAIVGDVAAALEAAHAEGLVHRDVKPQNVIVVPQSDGGERAYLTDFGLTRPVEQDSELTRPDQAPGTPGYMAPEQLEGGPIDARVDVYALACMLFFALTARSPRGWSPVDELPTVGGDLDEVIRHGRARRPGDRYAGAGELAAAARAAAPPPEPPATPPAPATPAPGDEPTEVVREEPRFRSSPPVIAAVVGLAALVAVVVVLLSGGRDPSGQGAQATPTATRTAAGGETTTPTPTSGPGAALLARVPDPLRASCREEPALPTGSSAGLACAVTGADDLHYFDFGNGDAAESDYEQRVADAGTSRGAGDCATGALPAEEPAGDGRRVCYADGSGGHIDGVDGTVQLRLTADAGYSQQLLDAYDTASRR